MKICRFEYKNEIKTGVIELEYEKIIVDETKEVIATVFENKKTLFAFALEIHRFEGIVEDDLDIYLNSLNSFWLGVTETFQFK